MTRRRRITRRPIRLGSRNRPAPARPLPGRGPCPAAALGRQQAAHRGRAEGVGPDAVDRVGGDRDHAAHLDRQGVKVICVPKTALMGDGVVTVKNAQPGEIVSPQFSGGGGIAKIVDMDSLEVEVDVNENFITRVRPGRPASIRL